jgi:hypothetical protein
VQLGNHAKVSGWTGGLEAYIPIEYQIVIFFKW